MNRKSNYQVEDLLNIIKVNKQLKGDEFQRFLNAGDFQTNMNINGGSTFVIIDLNKMKYQYVSPSIKSISGFPAEKFIKEGVDFVFKIYHPDTKMTQKAIHNELKTFLNEIPKKNRSNYIFTYDVKVKNSKGKYIRILQRNRFLLFDKNGIPLLVLAICHDITEYRTDQKHTLVISQILRDQEKILFKKDFFPNYENGILTKKEIEVWKLVSEGHISKDIALKLNIKLNTVLTHRKKICKKLKSIKG